MTYPLPSGWQEFKLKDICNIQDGIHTTPNYVDKGIKFISVENISNIYASNKFISVEDYNNLYKVKAKKNDIFMTRIGDIGTPAVVTEDEELAYYVTISLLSNINKKIYYKYLYYAIQSHNFQRELYARTLHVAFPKKINLGEIGECKFISPPLDEQKRIAEVLSLCDDIIENLTELIDKKEQYKKGVMQRVLSGEVRFKGFKDEWTFKSLEKLCNTKKGEQKNKLDLVENGKYPVLSGGMDFSGYYNSYNREANTITISEGGNSCGYVNFIKTKFWASGHCYTLHDVNIDSLFLYQCLKYNENKIMKLRLGSGLPNIQLSYIREYTLKIPTSIEEQKKIAGLLSAIDEEIENLKKQLELRKQQKKGLMQKLLTGEVRI